MGTEAVKCGRFIGTSQDGVNIFRGITFARYERFREAVMESSDEEVDATTWGAVCPQRSNRLADILGEDKGPVCEEGRLCLSVYAPEGANGLPVMVWIHGGAFLTGGSEEHRYSGERLVKAGNVIVVKISYRLGAFGYLYLPEQGICNLGLKDQKLALEWIHREIAAFGGDPDNVTLFGQSAGAQSIAALIATSTEKPLFSKVIMQSTPLGIGITTEEASEIAAEFCKQLAKIRREKDGSHDAASGIITDAASMDALLREATMDDILDAQEKVQGMKTGLTFMPVIKDYAYVPDCVVSSRLSIVAGYTSEDGSPFIRAALGSLFDTAIGRSIIHIVTKKIFSRPTESYLKKTRALGLCAQRYFISWHPAGNPMGACHCIELPFILGEYEDWTKAQMLEGMTREEFDANSAACLNAWTEFARTGVFPEIGILKCKGSAT